MTSSTKAILTIIVLAILLLGGDILMRMNAIVNTPTSEITAQPDDMTSDTTGTPDDPLGAVSDDNVYKFASSSSVWLPANTAKVVAQYSAGRSYLAISNISGATSTPPSTVYCAVGVTPTLYNGIPIFGSTTKEWLRATIPTGAVTCISLTAGAVAVVEK